jgi:hypothetical protein
MVFDPRRRSFQLQTLGLSGGERLFPYELRAIAQELGVPEASKLGISGLIAAIERIDPTRLEKE